MNKLKILFRKIIRLSYFSSFYILENLVLIFLLFLKIDKEKINYNNIFIKIDGIGDWIYFQPIFLNLLKSFEKKDENNLIILSNKLKPFLKDYKNSFDFYFFDVDKVSSFNILYIIKYLIDFKKFGANKLINLNFWSKYNWCNFPMRNISSPIKISFDCYDDLYPRFLLKSKYKGNYIKYHFNCEKLNLEKNNYHLPLIDLLDYQSFKLNEIYPRFNKVNFLNFINCQEIDLSNKKTIALFPFASVSSKSLNPILLNNLLNLLDSCGFEVKVFGSKSDSKKFKNIKRNNLTNRIKIFNGKIPLNQIYDVLNECRLILTVDSFVSHLMISNKSSPPLLVLNSKRYTTKIEKFFFIKHNLVDYLYIDNEFELSCKKDIDIIVNNFFRKLNN